MKKTNTKKGFTIIELVIVIAVIGILAAVLIPTFSGVIEKANESAAMQAARNEYEVYLSEHAAELTGEENFVIVYKTYAFKVTKGQFDATALEAEKTTHTGTVDLTKVKSVKATTAAKPTVTEKVDNTDITIADFFTEKDCSGTKVESFTAGTTYYYVSNFDIGNAEVAIYKAA